MEKQILVVDGKVMGTFKKSAQLGKLKKLKGIEIRTTRETEKERIVRLQLQREKRKQEQCSKDLLNKSQPSLIEGIPTMKAFYKEMLNGD